MSNYSSTTDDGLLQLNHIDYGYPVPIPGMTRNTNYWYANTIHPPPPYPLLKKVSMIRLFHAGMWNRISIHFWSCIRIRNLNADPDPEVLKQEKNISLSTIEITF